MKAALIGLALLFTAPLAQAQEMTTAPGGVLRWLDKLTGVTEDVDLTTGQTSKHGRLTITLDECRYPVEDPTSNAVAHLTITDDLHPEPVFVGWMIATSPALSALDHPRYDVWVLRCITPAGNG